jgi:DNA-binding XRE family transcriptional regulator
MAEKTVGTLIKEARTAAGLTQEQLARKIKGVSADDISLAERGKKDFTQAVLKEIAKATGVTQKSLLDAAKAGSSAKTGASSKTGSSAKTGASPKTGSSAKTSASSKTGSSAKTGASSKTGSGAKTGASSKTGNSAKTASSSSSTLKLSAEEKRVLKAYREAEEGVQSIVRALLGADTQSSSASKKNSSLLESLLGGLAQNNSAPASTDGGSGNLLDVFMGMLGGK